MRRDTVIALIIGFAICIPMNWDSVLKMIIGAVSVAGAAWMLLVATDPELRRDRR